MRARFLAGLTVGLTVAAALTMTAPGAVASGSPAPGHSVHRWRTDSPGPNPQVPDYGLGLVSCLASGSCLAIGTSQTSDGAKPVSQIWNGKAWSTKLGSLPVIPGRLSCATIRSCMAVGVEVVDGSEVVAMAEHWNGAGWSQQALPSPPAGATGSELDGVSCPAANSCIAIGSYRMKRGPRVPLAESWNGEAWTLQVIPGPPNRTFYGLDAFSCASARFCVAIGGYGRGFFTDTWNGATWQAKLATGPGPADDPTIFSMQCTSATACLAVGIQFALHWNGTKWQRVPPAMPKGNAATLTSVSCTSDTNCEAAGESTAERWDGKKWFVQPGLPTDNRTRFAGVTSVSCVSQFNCIAVGDYQTRATPTLFTPLASHYS
jgi:hypothetical protein